MEGISDSLRLGWDALLLKEEAYEKMRVSDSPVTKGLILIIVVGVVIALLGVLGTILEWATTPNLAEIRDVVWTYMTQMPWWQDAARYDPNFAEQFQRFYDMGWSVFPSVFGGAQLGGALANIILIPLGLIVRWLLYGIVAYIFARWLGGTADLGQTLGVLALAVAPQALTALGILPYLTLGSLVSIWAILCAFVGLKTVHKLTWSQAMWATLLPFIVVLAGIFAAACCSSLAIAAALS